MSNNIFVTGFYGTGSSAVIDLLKEFEGVDVAIGDRYEHCLFLGQSCLLDLYQRLYGEYSNRMTQDIAINDFIDEMTRQNKYDFGWYGSYKKLFGDEFKNAFEEFVASISVSVKDNAIAHAKGIRFSLIKCFLQIGAAILRGYKITKLGRTYCYDGKDVRYLTASEDEFVEHARLFVKKYFKLCGGNTFEVYDHIILPEQCGAMKKFFTDEKLIIVDRDPRDVYLSSYHIWNTVRCGLQRAPFPDGIDKFCATWKRTHELTLKNVNCDRIKIVRFEDLIYKYDETVKDIAEFCGLDLGKHTARGKVFVPDKSIKNTQVFRKSPKFNEETEILERELCNYLYDFPFKTTTPVEDVVDL